MLNDKFIFKTWWFSVIAVSSTVSIEHQNHFGKVLSQKESFFQPLMCHNFSNVNVSNDEGENGIRGGVQGKVFKKKWWNSKLKFKS